MAAISMAHDKGFHMYLPTHAQPVRQDPSDMTTQIQIQRVTCVSLVIGDATLFAGLHTFIMFEIIAGCMLAIAGVEVLRV